MMRRKLDGPLHDVRILVAEDNHLVADFIKQVLTDAGAQVLDPVATSEACLKALDGKGVDGVIVDLFLTDGMAVQVIERLQSERIPLVLVTGWSDLVPESARDLPTLHKPFNSGQIIRMAAQHFTNGERGEHRTV